MKTKILACLLFASLGAEALAPVPVWEGAPPAETRKQKPGTDPKGVVNEKGHRSEVMIPEFVAWPAANPGAPIVIVCPGGGYSILAEEHEGAPRRALAALAAAAMRGWVATARAADQSCAGNKPCK